MNNHCEGFPDASATDSSVYHNPIYTAGPFSDIDGSKSS